MPSACSFALFVYVYRIDIWIIFILAVLCCVDSIRYKQSSFRSCDVSKIAELYVV